MANASWRTVPRANFMALHAARLQAHYAAQWLARSARTYLQGRPGDEHTNLGWDEGFGGLVTHPLRDGSRLGLRVADLTLALLGAGAAQLPLDGRADPEVRRWLGEALAGRGLTAGKLDAPPPYDLPDHVIALGQRYSLEEQGEAFGTLSAWFANAHSILTGAQQHLARQRYKAPPVRCWPHHFDLDCLVALPRGRSMGLGFSPGDDYCDEPYFYTTMYPEPPIPRLPLLPAMAHWHTYQFLAAMAPAHKIVAANDQGAYVQQFIDTSVKVALDALR